MGVDTNIYIGCYLRVWMPKTMYLYGKTCPNGHSVQVGHYTKQFCPFCGLEMVDVFKERGKTYHEVSSNQNFYEATDSYLEDEKEYRAIVSNRFGNDSIKLSDQNESGDQELNLTREFGADWKELEKELSDKGIKFEEKFGIVTWYS